MAWSAVTKSPNEVMFPISASSAMGLDAFSCRSRDFRRHAAFCVFDLEHISQVESFGKCVNMCSTLGWFSFLVPVSSFAGVSPCSMAGRDASLSQDSLSTMAGNTGTRFWTSNSMRWPLGEIRTGFSPAGHSKPNPSCIHRLPKLITHGESFNTIAVASFPVFANDTVVSLSAFRKPAAVIKRYGRFVVDVLRRSPASNSCAFTMSKQEPLSTTHFRGAA